MGFFTGDLPDFPWDSLIPARQRAAQYPGGAIDLTIGTPVDPVPAFIQAALGGASDAHAYPATIGSNELRTAIARWLHNHRGVTGTPGILPTIGSKEMVALLPSFLGFGKGDTVAFPRMAYPTYDVGARIAGATPLPLNTDADPETWPEGIALLWLNSPGNPDGHVLGIHQLKRLRAWARAHGTIIASDECYAELTWDVPEAPSILDTRVCGTDYRDIFCLYSLSKQSNMAGYRGAFIAGDPERIATLTQLRKHAGFMMPTPIQHAMAVALGDEAHVTAQKETYRLRREALSGVLEAAGLRNDPKSVAGLYLWAEDASGRANGWEIVNACARIGIVVAPGDFYGEAARGRVRISLTATDEAIGEAIRRLPALPGELRHAAAKPRER